MNDEEILGVRNPAQCKAYSDADRAVITMADELHDNSEVSPKTWAALEKSFSTAELVELILVAGFWHMMAGFLKTAKLPLDSIDKTLTGWPEGQGTRLTGRANDASQFRRAIILRRGSVQSCADRERHRASSLCLYTGPRAVASMREGFPAPATIGWVFKGREIRESLRRFPQSFVLSFPAGLSHRPEHREHQSLKR